MQEVLAQVFTYIWGVWRYRWMVIIIAWLVAVGGWVWVWQMPDAYVATARVYVDTNSVLRPLLRGLAFQPNVNQRISMMSRTLLSRPNLEKLMRMTDLDLQVNTELEKEAMLTRLRESVSLNGSRDNASLYSIRVNDSDRDTAVRIAQSLITVFIESSLSEKREDSSGAQDFLDDQIVEYEERLVAAENRLAQFKQKNVDILPGSGGDYYSRLKASRQDLQLARLQLSELENRQREVQRQLDGEVPVFMSSSSVIVSTGRMSPVDTRIQTLRVSLDGLLSRYTDKHPEVRQIRALIAELQAERAQEYSRVKKSVASGSSADFANLSNSPVYQGMRSMLAQTEATLAELQVRVVEYERRSLELDGKVNQIPEIEAELKQLDRDYAVISGQHQQLLQRRESARISEDVEQNASDVTFRVIDPPFAPHKPTEPNKTLLNGAVLLLGIAGGLGVGLLTSLVYPLIGDPRTLVTVTGMPILGTVTLKQKNEEKRKELYGLLTYASVTAALLIVCVGLSFGQGILFS